MKLLIIADLHSNIHALEAIWSAEGDADRVVCAGDLVDYGPFPQQIVEWILDHNVTTVQGNHDRSIIRAFRSALELVTLPPERTFWHHHNALRVDAAIVDFLDALPSVVSFQIDGVRYGMSHYYRDYEVIESARQFDEFRAVAFEHNSQPPVTQLIFGHTHRQSIRDFGGGRLSINPGSTSYRRSDDPDQRAHYAVVIDGKPQLRSVEYDVSPVLAATSKAELFPHEREMTDWFFGQRNHTMATRYPE